MEYRKRNQKINADYIFSLCSASNNGCVEWRKARSPDGYGVIRIENKNHLVHRIVYEMTYGKIENNLLVCHKCDNPPCCNPNHLFLGTPKDNTSDMLKKKRENRNSRNVGESHGKAKLTERDIVNIRNLSKEGNSMDKISRIYKVSIMHISHIVNNKRWKHIKTT